MLLNVILSQAAVRMGCFSVIYYYCLKKKQLALPDISYYLSQGRSLIHTYIVRKELSDEVIHETTVVALKTKKSNPPPACSALLATSERRSMHFETVPATSERCILEQCLLRQREDAFWNSACYVREMHFRTVPATSERCILEQCLLRQRDAL